MPNSEIRPAPRPRLSIPFTGTATSRDYQPFPPEALLTKPLIRNEPITDHISGQSADISANWNSTHRDAFRFLPQSLAKPQTISSARRLVLPFTGQSTSRADFQAPPAEVIRGSCPNSAALKSFCDRDDLHIPDLLDSPKFEGSSSYSSEFKAYPLSNPQANLQYGLHLDLPLPFEGVSECQSQYREFKVEPTLPKHADNKTFISSISSPGSVFEGTTEFHDSFRPISFEKSDHHVEPYPLDPPIPFDGTTESRDSYRPLSFYETFSGRQST